MMNRRQKLVQQQFLNSEEAVIKRLNQVYSQSLKDINGKIQNLSFTIGKLQQEYDWMDDLDPEKAKIKSQIQSKIYQKQYQEQLQKQVEGIFNQMQTSQFVTVSDYLDTCYSDGFIGTIFDAHGQGVPIVSPINQEAMVRAVQLDSKISKGLYTRLGEDVNLLKKKITAQVSRSIATGMTYAQTAKALENYSRIGYNNAIRIARTEGHRIQTTATMDAMTEAKDRGADIVKQWDATLDGATRESHVAVDGQIRELNEKFSNGLDYPGDPDGGAAEVINCRCALLQRARWAVGDGFTKFNNFTKQVEEFDSPADYDEFKKAFFSPENRSYMNYVQELEEKYGTRDFPKLLDRMTDREYQHYSMLFARNPLYGKNVYNSSTNKKAKNDIIKPDLNNEHMKALAEGLNKHNVEYRKVKMHAVPLSEDEIIDALSGGDLTRGSCASLGLAYMGQKGGMDVLDFRDGESRSFFSSDYWLQKIAKLPNTNASWEYAKSSVTSGNRLLKLVESGKEYYFVSGRHAAIVRRTDAGVLQYLELQSATRSGWHNFNGNPRATLASRFGEIRSTYGSGCESYMIDVDSFKNSDDLRYLLGYINTSEDKQRKGKHGTIK